MEKAGLSSLFPLFLQNMWAVVRLEKKKKTQ